MYFVRTRGCARAWTLQACVMLSPGQSPQPELCVPLECPPLANARATLARPALPSRFCFPAAVPSCHGPCPHRFPPAGPTGWTGGMAPRCTTRSHLRWAGVRPRRQPAPAQAPAAAAASQRCAAETLREGGGATGDGWHTLCSAASRELPCSQPSQGALHLALTAHAVPCRAALRCAAMCCSVPCCAVLCRAMLCCNVLRCAVPRCRAWCC